MKLHRRIIRSTEVKSRTGYPDSTLYEKIAKREFPPPVKLGPRAVGWVEDEVDEHVEKLIAARDSGKDRS